MPTIDLEKGPQSLSRYDVIGQCDEQGTRFVTHVGLLGTDDRLVEVGNEVNAVHMVPPLQQGKPMKAHVAGHVPLTNDEIKEISAWIQEVADEYHGSGADSWRHQYVIDPPWKDKTDPNTGTRRYRRYSCAGFVLDSHCQVDIELLKLSSDATVDQDALPDVDKEKIAAAYPVDEMSPRLLGHFGLTGDGPWRIVLPGYILHALDRPTDLQRQEPYHPRSGDEQF